MLLEYITLKCYLPIRVAILWWKYVENYKGQYNTSIIIPLPELINITTTITAEQLLFLKINKIQQIELKSFCITPQTNSPPSLPITINNHEFDVYPSHPILTHCKHFHEKKMQYYLGYLKKVKYHMHHSVAHFSYSTLCFWDLSMLIYKNLAH